MADVEPSRLLSCLAADYARFRTVTDLEPGAGVPSCPGWSVTDLVRHLAQVYLHKAETMRTGRRPDPWPPAGVDTEDSAALLERSYAALTEQFALHDPADPVWTWHGPEQTVGFWIRRMAQETVVHRLDAELALAEPVAPIPDDLAVDGIDEVLKLFVAYGVRTFPDEFREVLDDAVGHIVAVSVDGGGWLVTSHPGGVEITDRPADAVVDGADPVVDATVRGAPAAVLRWLWARDGDGGVDVKIQGDAAAVRGLRRLLAAATQ